MDKKMENEMDTGVIKGLYRDPRIQIRAPTLGLKESENVTYIALFGSLWKMLFLQQQGILIVGPWQVPVEGKLRFTSSLLTPRPLLQSMSKEPEPRIYS